MKDITIRKLASGDWEIFRALRLKAIHDHPTAFATNIAQENAAPPAYWQEILDGNGKAVFGIFDGATLIGIGGAFPSRHEPAGQTAYLGMDFIHADYRGRHLTHLLYSARLDWIKAQNKYVRILVSHRGGNEASRRAIEHFGFRHYETDIYEFGDGPGEHVRYELTCSP